MPPKKVLIGSFLHRRPESNSNAFTHKFKTDRVLDYIVTQLSLERDILSHTESKCPIGL
jgi:hypothetical protein